MSDKKGKQESCYQTSACGDSVKTSAREELETPPSLEQKKTSCCSSKEPIIIPIVQVNDKNSCCSSKKNDTEQKLDSSDSCCNSVPTQSSSCCSSTTTIAQGEAAAKVSSCCSKDSEPTEQPSVTGDGVQTYLIEGMDCGACALTIEKHLQSVPGVQDVRVNFATGKMQIRHERDVDKIIKEVSKAGFKAELAGKRGRFIRNSSYKTG